MPLKKVSDIRPYLGCDPEFFFKSNGEVIGAEKILPKDGLLNSVKSVNEACVLPESVSKCIIDGVQAELNPRPNTCRANLANEIQAMFRTLKATMDTNGNQLTADFNRTVVIDKKNLMELDEKSRKFGCAPSSSIYEDAGVKIAELDPTEYRTRAAGGHIHIGKSVGYGATAGLVRAVTTDVKRTVAMLDLICGNTSVLVDRDEGNIERRKVYGRAGEFRLPPHGLEYRTLSNFWLTSYPLMSFAFGMARLAVQLMADGEHDMYYNEFTSKVKSKDVHDAINNNDFDQAVDNFHAIEPLILEASGSGDNYAVHKNNIIEFKHFVNTIQDKGLEHWFSQDPIEHWTTIPECHNGGFSDYLQKEVREDMKKAKAA